MLAVALIGRISDKIVVTSEAFKFILKGTAGARCGLLNANPSCCPLRPRTTPCLEEKSTPGVIYGVLLWAGMNAATPLGALWRSVISLASGLATQRIW